MPRKRLVAGGNGLGGRYLACTLAHTLQAHPMALLSVFSFAACQTQTESESETRGFEGSEGSRDQDSGMQGLWPKSAGDVD